MNYFEDDQSDTHFWTYDTYERICLSLTYLVDVEDLEVNED